MFVVGSMKNILAGQDLILQKKIILKKKYKQIFF
jgi:hypothetical protein